jgi:NAD(P)-dependent dehydrogenase (short-subunit alcohol dehydrogenase family)
MVEQICLVTGATSGIGRATAHELASRGASVVIHGRRPAELDAAAADIRASTSNEKVTVLLADLASLGSIRQATDRFVAEHDRLHVLVNNAGVSLTHRSVTADGFETTFAVNHLAPLPAHEPAAGTAAEQCTQQDRQRHLDRLPPCADQL